MYSIRCPNPSHYDPASEAMLWDINVIMLSNYITVTRALYKLLWDVEQSTVMLLFCS